MSKEEMNAIESLPRNQARNQMISLIDLITSDNSYEGAQFASQILNAWRVYTAPPIDLGYIGGKDEEVSANLLPPIE